MARPTQEDPVALSASEAVGGPPGEHARPHPWWTPVRVVLAVATVAALLGMVQKTPCVVAGWPGGDYRYAALCYSDVPYLYVPRGFAERTVPYTDTGGRYEVLEYPVLTGLVAYGTALATHAATGWPDVEERRAGEVDALYADRAVARESRAFFELTAVLVSALAILAAGLLAAANRGRPWDAMAYAASPALVLTGLVNWDLVAVAATAAALLAWSRGRPGWAGVAIGLGTAAKLYPLFLLGALLVVCLRRRRLGAFASAVGGAVLAWLVVNVPVLVASPQEWLRFWTFNSERGADLGSLWLVLEQAGTTVPASAINLASWVWFAGVCVAVLALGLLAPRTPRVAQLALLVVVGFVLFNKVYSPQYVLWLLPLAVLARPRWRDLLVWQAAEAFYFVAVWFYLGGYTASASSGADDRTYWLAIGVRMAAEVWLAAVVVRDVLRPARDPVRADGVTDDPLEPVARRDR